MAVEPLFNADKDSLLKRIRMSTVSDTVAEAVDGIIQEVRLGFFAKLGKERSLQVAGYSLVDNPSSDEEILRVSAATAEGNWVAYLISGRFPMLLLDGTMAIRQDWNDEPLTRDATAIQMYRKELKAAVDAAIGELAEPVSENSGDVKVSLNGSEEPFLISENFVGLTSGYGAAVTGRY
jgi:hypothetical protein